ncbi:MAG: ABC transporter permease [Bacteroidota bacterium]
MKEQDIPKWPIKLLRQVYSEHFLEEIEGDLIQRFFKDQEKFNHNKARRRFIWSAVRYFRLGIAFRNRKYNTPTQINMITNYFKVAYRVMLRYKAFTTLNVLALSVGLTGALLLFLWIQQEFSYDQFHTDKDRIYKAWNRTTQSGKTEAWSSTPRILAPTLKEEFSSVESTTSVAQWQSKQLFTVGDTRLLKTTGIYTTADFLNIFSFPLIKGNQNTALNEPASIILTESFARQLFGDREAYGETMTLGESGYSFEFKITGIMADLPANTDFNFEYLIPFKFLESIGENDTFWGNNNLSTYVKIKEGADITTVNEAIRDIKKKNYPKDPNAEVFLYPLTKMRLYSRFENGVPAGGRIEVIRMLIILGICLVVIACINFINLSTARAQRRAKEVAVRKVTGAFRYTLILQFLCESLLITFLAAFISIAVALITLPFFNQLIGQQLSLNFDQFNFWLVAISIVFVVGLMAGTYPAIILSAFKPVKILKGAFSMSVNKNFIRNALVIFQFGFAIMLIVSAIVINNQINHVQNRASGYDKNDLIYQPLTGDLGKNYLSYRNDLLNAGIAISVTKTSSPITQRWSSSADIKWEGQKPEENYNFERIYMDDQFSKTAGLTIVQSRDMDLSKYPSDSTAVLLNETAAEIMGFENPIGELIIDNGIEWRVTGVVKDFILTSPHAKIEPMVLLGSKASWALGYVHIKLNKANVIQKQIEQLAELSEKYNPNYPFEFEFVDVEYQQKFSGMKKTQTITTIFSSLAIFIACLGLFGLATFMAEARIKEIGIRKVFGGSVLTITKLLSLSSLKPIFISILLFSPMAWYSMNWWLQTFAYRIDLSVGTFILAALTIILIALITISSQTISAATKNPIKSLRSD